MDCLWHISLCERLFVAVVAQVLPRLRSRADCLSSCRNPQRHILSIPWPKQGTRGEAELRCPARLCVFRTVQEVPLWN